MAQGRLKNFRNTAILGLCVLASLAAGCGATTRRVALEQLLVSDAVDQAVSKIDFSPLKGERVYLKTDFIKTIRTTSNINGNYVVSSLRHQIVAAGCLLQDKVTTADIILEPRVGALGSDEYQITYGVPNSNSAAAISALAGASTPIPTIPEISVGKSEHRQGIAKISVYAYRKEDQAAIWQSGIAKSTATSRDLWIFGAGPFQRGSIYDSPQFAGSTIQSRWFGLSNDKQLEHIDKDYLFAKDFRSSNSGGTSSEGLDAPSGLLKPLEKIADRPKGNASGKKNVDQRR